MTFLLAYQFIFIRHQMEFSEGEDDSDSTERNCVSDDLSHPITVYFVHNEAMTSECDHHKIPPDSSLTCVKEKRNVPHKFDNTEKTKDIEPIAKASDKSKKKDKKKQSKLQLCQSVSKKKKKKERVVSPDFVNAGELKTKKLKKKRKLDKCEESHESHRLKKRRRGGQKNKKTTEAEASEPSNKNNNSFGYNKLQKQFHPKPARNVIDIYGTKNNHKVFNSSEEDTPAVQESVNGMEDDNIPGEEQQESLEQAKKRLLEKVKQEYHSLTDNSYTFDRHLLIKEPVGENVHVYENGQLHQHGKEQVNTGMSQVCLQWESLMETRLLDIV
ncbi:glutamic acid-rich protein-like [Pecten maximus]|uniref:glutamic acid-rich protein-like n=1 Tax=Pecten maximus TaxID=6579 RepID=UPI0014584D62|nr:glutamic acid-rich protein-like [Pecten maximus]